MNLAIKFQIRNKFLVVTHVYYSQAYWVPSTSAYQELEKVLHNFLWYIIDGDKGFLRVNQNVSRGEEVVVLLKSIPKLNMCVQMGHLANQG
jgi:hypothetical protein